MFNYLGDGPATMPGAVPGAPPPSTTGMVGPVPGAPPGILAPSGPLGPSMFPQMPEDPASVKYSTETQQDGTVLLRRMLPDGSPGPVVLITKPPQPGAAKKR